MSSDVEERVRGAFADVMPAPSCEADLERALSRAEQEPPGSRRAVVWRIAIPIAAAILAGVAAWWGTRPAAAPASVQQESAATAGPSGLVHFSSDEKVRVESAKGVRIRRGEQRVEAATVELRLVFRSLVESDGVFHDALQDLASRTQRRADGTSSLVLIIGADATVWWPLVA